MDRQDESLKKDWVVFHPSPIHGMGGFAARAINRDIRILEYLGRRISKQESVRLCAENNEYIFGLNEHEDLDGNVSWNLARFLNHSCAPNCEAIIADERIWIAATREVEPGEELTFNYGYDLENYREYPCCCGAATCVGYIVAEEFFEHVRSQARVA